MHRCILLGTTMHRMLVMNALRKQPVLAGLPLLVACLLITFASDATPVQADEDDTPLDDIPCYIHYDQVREPLRFEDYPAKPRLQPGTAAPILDTPGKRMFRTRIRLAARSGPPFAGHYRVGLWGAGTSNMQIVIVNTRTGVVTIPPNLQSLWFGHIHDDMLYEPRPGLPHPALRFTATSKLLIALGAPNETSDREGVYFFEWTGRELREIRFIPRQEACKPIQIP